MFSTPTSTFKALPRSKVSRACEPCRLRKVKCNGNSPCTQCAHLGLQCLYPIASKPRSQGKRGRVISNYRQQTANVSSSVLSVTTPVGLDSSKFGREFFARLIPEYMETVYPVHPIMSGAELRDNIDVMDIDSEANAFVHAFAACTLNLCYVGPKRTEHISETIERLMRKSIAARDCIQRGQNSSIRLCVTCLHLHNCWVTLRNTNAALYYLREATTLIEMLHVEDDRSMDALDNVSRAQLERLYWLGFVQERFHAIAEYRPTVLQPLKQLPGEDISIAPGIRAGFNHIIRLFRLVDSEFINNWLGQSSTSITPDWIENKQTELDALLCDPWDNDDALKSMQKADLIVTNQWLKTLIWRLAMANTVMSSNPSTGCLSLLFPIRLSEQLREQVSTMSKEDIEVHGIGIVHKLYEVTDTVADVIIAAPAHSIQDTANKVDDFLFLAQYLFSFTTLDLKLRSLLNEKLEMLQRLFPKINSPSCSKGIPSYLASFKRSNGGRHIGETHATFPSPSTASELMLDNPDVSTPRWVYEASTSFPSPIEETLFMQYNEIANQLSAVSGHNTGAADG